jgi:hypothetical protein
LNTFSALLLIPIPGVGALFFRLGFLPQFPHPITIFSLSCVALLLIIFSVISLVSLPTNFGSKIFLIVFDGFVNVLCILLKNLLSEDLVLQY